MTDKLFDHRPDPELGAALRAALEAERDQAEFVARVMSRYDDALERATVPTWEVLASWSRRGIAAAAVAALLGGFLLGRVVLTPAGAGDSTASIESAMAPAEGGAGGGRGLTALVTAPDPPDASVVLTSLVEPQ
jgi:hypothetical protein